ncbi:Uncharacterized conserved protein, DUF4415 family [Rhizobiales bacterium GAS113]|jgi:uncharacterized protein (DUF4415 family)|nr:Uncharacterized conserved protein, DUF4415 family [Rhizobiales bacterium GAS113]SEC04144.1 Uncharacterized conserved protein, DUF4415 family [Rhizobiales bacterium GAS188]
MSKPPFRSRIPTGARDAAEAAFKSVTTKPVQAVTEKPKLPGVRELVSLRLDRDVLEHFQEGGPGWQERINEALRKAAGI